MAVLGFLGASSPSLWADELATWVLATAPLDDLLRVLKNADASIGPYYLFMHGWIGVFGDSELAMRAPSILAMTGATALTVGLGTRLAGRRVGVIAGLLFALMPAVSRYAHEARPYALAVFFAALATYLLVRVLDRPSTVGLVCYGLAVLLLGLAHFVALMLLAAHGLTVLSMCRSLIRRWLVAAALAVVAITPLMYLGQRQRGQISWIPELTGLRLLQTPGVLTGSLLMSGTLLVLGFLAFSWRAPALVWTLWAVLPTIGLGLVSVGVPMWLPRYLLFTLPAWVLLAATVVSRLRILRGAVFLALVGVLVVYDHVQIRGGAGHTHDSRAIGMVLNQHAVSSDAVMYGKFDEDFGPRLAVARYTDAAHRPNDVLAEVPAMAQGNFRAVECVSAVECAGDPDRVWVIRPGNRTDVLAGIGKDRETLLRAGYVTAQTWNLIGFTVALLTRKAPPAASGGIVKK
ncbi:glycosyltransferase family 39 protein [Allorhizocola rhizosphaerae]|uniref:glycosyltransferase family 39 protein n=1 Tax=Allorhizocola rhizosphaerae TaxID=1872709 RepID=UPI001FE2CD7F|nr:glycosyltransferase family 39 protein [Allorhizocola rhizosphaerae]